MECRLRFFWIRKAVEHFKQDLTGHTSRSKEDSGAENNADYGGSAQEVSEENNISK